MENKLSMSDEQDSPTFRANLAYQETFNCVQCGYCLPVCPTYKTMKKETHSPRGRINLVKLAAEGNVSLEALKEPIDLCLGCRACETACPTNVQYGQIFESAKKVLQEKEKHEHGGIKKVFQGSLFKGLFPKKRALAATHSLLWAYQASGLQKVVHKTGLASKLLPENISVFESITPRVMSPKAHHKRVKHATPRDMQQKYKVAFFRGCVMDVLFDKINDLSVKLLQAAGCEVVVVENQTCCGALHSHSGEVDLAKILAKQNIEAFEKESFDFIVNNAGGCGAMLIEYAHLFEEGTDWHKRAQQFSKKSIDISVLLVQLRLPFKQRIDCRVTYQPSCHMTNVQKVVDEPKQLIQSIDGIDFHELNDPNFCCGSAGIYNIVNYDESMKILDAKMDDVLQHKPELIVTTNPGCLLQMKVGLKREQQEDRIRAIHLVELLAEACGME